jgi:ABC-type lipoprotein release transport system permease subunit
MRELVVGLFTFCAFLAAVALAHALVVSTHRRGHDLGVLAALGLVGRQRRTIVWVQALTLTALGLVVGIPGGILVGRAAWRAAIGDVGMIVAPSIPQLTLLAVAAAALAIGWLISLVPGAWAAHTRAAVQLRSE